MTVEVRTDSPRRRFASGAVLLTSPGGATLTVRTARVHNGTWLIAFEGVTDRNGAEALRDTLLFAEGDSQPDAESDSQSDAGSAHVGGGPGFGEATGADEDGWYADELVGLTVLDPTGHRIGEVVSLDIRPAQDLLGVRLDDGRFGLVPFVRALVPHLDVPDRIVVVDPPEGLFDLGQEP